MNLLSLSIGDLVSTLVAASADVPMIVKVTTEDKEPSAPSAVSIKKTNTVKESSTATKKNYASFVLTHNPIILALDFDSQSPPKPSDTQPLAGPNLRIHTLALTATMGSAHSKPKKSVAARKNEISYPRTQANSKPLHAYGHSDPRPSQPRRQQQPAKHHSSKHFLCHPAEPQYHGTFPAARPKPAVKHYGKPKLVSVYQPEVQYYGTFPAKKPIKRKPVPPPSQAQVQYYSKRALPPVPGSRAAAKSMRVQYSGSDFCEVKTMGGKRRKE
ncbi:MAG: hypothetical protein Q9171_002297 [Xanthocarpia ochracea]